MNFRPIHIVLTCIALAGVSVSASDEPRKARLLPYEKVHKEIRKYVGLMEGHRLMSCGNLVYVGTQYPPFGDYDPANEIIIADGPATYFDNRSGRVVAHCDFWYCTKHSDFCIRNCPLKEWKCRGLDVESPSKVAPESANEK